MVLSHLSYAQSVDSHHVLLLLQVRFAAHVRILLSADYNYTSLFLHVSPLVLIRPFNRPSYWSTRIHPVWTEFSRWIYVTKERSTKRLRYYYWNAS